MLEHAHDTTGTTKPPTTTAVSSSPMGHHLSMHDRLCRCTSSCNATQHTFRTAPAATLPLDPAYSTAAAVPLVAFTSCCEQLSSTVNAATSRCCERLPQHHLHNWHHTRSRCTPLQGQHQPLPNELSFTGQQLALRSAKKPRGAPHYKDRHM